MPHHQASLPRTITSLQSLPPELIEIITSHLLSHHPYHSYFTPLDSLYALRLTSRRLNLLTQHNFGTTAFSTLFVDFTVHSLDRFHAIGQHKFFGGYVRNIYFAHDAREVVSLGEFAPDEEKEENDNEAEKKHSTASPRNNTPTQTALLLSQMQKSLTTTLTRLPRLESIIIIAPLIAEFSWTNSNPRIDKSDAPPPCLADTIPSTPGPSYTLTLTTFLPLLTTALSQPSAPRIRTLNTTVGRDWLTDTYYSGTHNDLDSRDPGFQSGALSLSPNFSSPPSSAFTSLHELRLLYNPGTPSETTALSSILSNTHALRILDLAFALPSPPPSENAANTPHTAVASLTASLLHPLSLPSLTTLHLTQLPLPAASLTTFLQSHAETLTHLSFALVRVVSGTWRSVIVCIARYLALMRVPAGETSGEGGGEEGKGRGGAMMVEQRERKLQSVTLHRVIEGHWWVLPWGYRPTLARTAECSGAEMEERLGVVVERMCVYKGGGGYVR